MDQQSRVAEIYSFTAFLFTRMVLADTDTRQTALAFFYPFFCPSFREAVAATREKLWHCSAAPFPFDPLDPDRDWWHPPSPFFTHRIPDGPVRWIVGEDLPGGPKPRGSNYREFMNASLPKPAWLRSLSPHLRKTFEDAFDETYRLNPLSWLYGTSGGRAGRLFDHTYLMEFARSNIPPLQPESQQVAFSHQHELLEDDEDDDVGEWTIEVKLFSRSVTPEEVARRYAAFLRDLSADDELRIFYKWPGGLPTKGTAVRIDQPRTDLNWIIPSVSFDVHQPWPSQELVAAFVKDLFDEFESYLAERPTRSESSNWIRALATTALVEFAGLSARQAISTWNRWANDLSVPSDAVGVPIWSAVEVEASPAEQHFSRERSKVMQIMRTFLDRGLCTIQSPTP
jgi:hypothetical protein